MVLALVKLRSYLTLLVENIELGTRVAYVSKPLSLSKRYYKLNIFYILLYYESVIWLVWYIFLLFLSCDGNYFSWFVKNFPLISYLFIFQYKNEIWDFSPNFFF